MLAVEKHCVVVLWMIKIAVKFLTYLIYKICK